MQLITSSYTRSTALTAFIQTKYVFLCPKNCCSARMLTHSMDRFSLTNLTLQSLKPKITGWARWLMNLLSHSLAILNFTYMELIFLWKKILANIWLLTATILVITLKYQKKQLLANSINFVTLFKSENKSIKKNHRRLMMARFRNQ